MLAWFVHWVDAECLRKIGVQLATFYVRLYLELPSVYFSCSIHPHSATISSTPQFYVFAHLLTLTSDAKVLGS